MCALFGRRTRKRGGRRRRRRGGVIRPHPVHTDRSPSSTSHQRQMSLARHGVSPSGVQMNGGRRRTRRRGGTKRYRRRRGGKRRRTRRGGRRRR